MMEIWDHYLAAFSLRSKAIAADIKLTIFAGVIGEILWVAMDTYFLTFSVAC